MRLAVVSFGPLRVTTAALSLVVASTASLAAEVDAAAILKCQAMQDDAARLACYDSLKSMTTPEQESSVVEPAPAEQSPVESPAVAPPPAMPLPKEPERASTGVAPVAKQPATAEPPPLDDETGQETMRGNTEKDRPVVRGRVVSCREEPTGKYLFYFDNGQIWRQKDNKELRWKECAFDVTISKDFFGYRMVPDGDDKRVRIARVK